MSIICFSQLDAISTLPCTGCFQANTFCGFLLNLGTEFKMNSYKAADFPVQSLKSQGLLFHVYFSHDRKVINFICN